MSYLYSLTEKIESAEELKNMWQKEELPEFLAERPNPPSDKWLTERDFFIKEITPLLDSLAEILIRKHGEENAICSAFTHNDLCFLTNGYFDLENGCGKETEKQIQFNFSEIEKVKEYVKKSRAELEAK
jgi:hypothetical protein